MNNSVITVIGKDRVGIVYDVSKILAENQINILNISQQLMDDFFYHDYFGGHFKMPQIASRGFGFVCGREQKTRARYPHAKRRNLPSHAPYLSRRASHEYSIRRNFRNCQNGGRSEF